MAAWQARAAFPDHPHGAVAAVIIEGDPPAEVEALLLPAEASFAAGLAPARRVTWIAGRIALAAALSAAGAPRLPLLATPRGAPLPPPGFVGSVSHKRRIAVAIAARDEGAGIGVDVEELVEGRHDVSARVLTEAELARVDALPREARWREVLRRFSLKESIYKAIDPFVKRYVGFKEAEIDAAGLTARMAPVSGEGPFRVHLMSAELDGHLLTSARADVDR